MGSVVSRIIPHASLELVREVARQTSAKYRNPNPQKNCYENQRARKEALKAENKESKKIILEKRALENRKKYQNLYDEFIRRGGPSWYESLTGMYLDRDRIYEDIDYFTDVLEVGVTVENLKDGEIKDPGRLHNKLKRERLAMLVCHRFENQPQYSERYLLIYHGTSRWADMKKIQSIYDERDRINKATGIEHHVDHIVPIVHKKVCGLHNEFNLRVIPAAENMVKSNKFDLDT